MNVAELLIKYTLSILIPILILIVILVIIKTLFEYFKYGKKIFSAFEKKDIPKAYDDILFITLDKIKGNKKIIKPNKLKSDYIFIYSKGIVLLKLFNEQGAFKYEDGYLYYDADKRIVSPSICFNDDIEKIKNIIPDIPIKSYMVTPEKTYIDGINYVSISKIIYVLKNDGDIKNIEEIEKLLSKSV